MGKRPLVRDLFTRSRGQPCTDSERPRPGPPPRKSPVPAPRDEIDARDRSRRRGEDGSYFEDVSTDQILTPDPGYDADVEVVRPYAIEEPDDDADQTSTSASTQPATPKLLEATERWQRELVNSLRGLYCDSDSNDTPPLTRHKRGRKRKTGPLVGISRTSRSMSDTKIRDIEMRAEETLSSPKRVRRKSTKPGEDIRMAYSSISNGRDPSTESSSAKLSSNIHGSGTKHDSVNDMSATDHMEVD